MRAGALCPQAASSRDHASPAWAPGPRSIGDPGRARSGCSILEKPFISGVHAYVRVSPAPHTFSEKDQQEVHLALLFTLGSFPSKKEVGLEGSCSNMGVGVVLWGRGSGPSPFLDVEWEEDWEGIWGWEIVPLGRGLCSWYMPISRAVLSGLHL